MRKFFFYRLCSGLIVVPPLSQRIHENPNEWVALLQVVVERIVSVRQPNWWRWSISKHIDEGKRLFASVGSWKPVFKSFGKIMRVAA